MYIYIHILTYSLSYNLSCHLLLPPPIHGNGNFHRAMPGEKKYLPGGEKKKRNKNLNLCSGTRAACFWSRSSCSSSSSSNFLRRFSSSARELRVAGPRQLWQRSKQSPSKAWWFKNQPGLPFVFFCFYNKLQTQRPCNGFLRPKVLLPRINQAAEPLRVKEVWRFGAGKLRNEMLLIA